MRRRLTFANVVAVMALFLALGNGVVHAAGGSGAGKIVGFARVKADGTVVAAKSFNVQSSNVTLESSSAYCFRDLPFAFKGAQVTIDYSGSENGLETAQFARGDPFDDCAGDGVQAEVATTDGIDFQPQSFYVVFYK